METFHAKIIKSFNFKFKNFAISFLRQIIWSHLIMQASKSLKITQKTVKYLAYVNKFNCEDTLFADK